jgi:Na+/H+ antiporter NhaD/arsenite permease-like protein
MLPLPVFAAVDGPVPSVFWTLPFALLLIAIAVLPAVPKLSHWWEHHLHKLYVGLAFGVVVLGYYYLRGYGLRGHGHTPAVAAGLPTFLAVFEHAVFEEYAPFVVLLFSLYTIAGGMRLQGTITPRPWVNTAILALGTALASLVGTTGASMILIVPLVDANRTRKHVVHTIVFFIFLVSNIGGLLTPLGDPPLFLGYLQGVPFFWTMRLFPIWLVTSIIVLCVYFVWDRIAYSREILSSPLNHQSIRLHGAINLLWLLGVVLSVGFIVPGNPLPGTQVTVPTFVREALMLTLVGLSLWTTPKSLKAESGFTYGAILEVACLFLGIFMTMRVPLEILQARGEALGLSRPGQFFWTCGALSSVLDNAPTYMVFFETARSLPAGNLGGLALPLASGEPIREDLLAAISCGAVLMGALSYIGNGPNLLVKSIAEARGVKMPGFFGYMAYSAAVLVPVFVVVSLRFFS